MGWFTAKSKEAEDRALTVSDVPPVMLRPTASGFTVNATNALFIADAYACIRVLADAVSTLPLVTYRRVGAERQRVDSGDVVDLLRRPSPAQTRSALLGTVMAHLCLHGNAYVGLFRGADGAVEQLAPLAPDRMQVRLRAGRLTYIYTDAEGHVLNLTDADLIHVRALSTDGFMGLSVVDQAREVLGLSAALTEYAARFFQNDARPSGLLHVGQGTAERTQGIADAWNSRHSGARNAHNIAIVQGEVTYTQLSATAADAQLNESRIAATVETARVFRVPPWMIGAPSGDSMTYANVESQQLAFLTHSVRPWCVAIEEAFNAHPELCPSGVFVEFLTEGMLRADSASRAAFYTAALNPDTGWMTREEVRRLENLPPEPNRPATPPAHVAHAQEAA